jgi:hypothetical protein
MLQIMRMRPYVQCSESRNNFVAVVIGVRSVFREIRRRIRETGNVASTDEFCRDKGRPKTN